MAALNKGSELKRGGRRQRQINNKNRTSVSAFFVVVDGAAFWNDLRRVFS